MSVSLVLLQRFRDLLHRYIPEFAPHNDREIVRCLFHQEKTPSLSIDLEKGVFHCFGCGVGGGVKDFARLVGEEWSLSRRESRAAKARQQHRSALAAAEQAFRAWERKKVIVLTDEYRLLSTQRDLIASQFRLIDRLTDAEATQVVNALSDFYDRAAGLEYALDLLTYEKHKLARVQWWAEEEAEGGR